MKHIKDIVRNLLPYAIVTKIQKERRDKRSFLNGYLAYILDNRKLGVLKSDSAYDKVVSVQGFGYSGSGAVLDLLREYDDVLVVGHVDKEGSVVKNAVLGYEVDFIRMAGGLLEIEKFIGSHNIFQNDALLHRVALMIQDSQIYRGIPESRPIFYEFFSKICTISGSIHPQLQYYNTYLKHDSKLILYLNDISPADYRQLAKQLINSILSLYHTSSEQNMIVMDQLFSDMEFDIVNDSTYVSNLKTIVVYRDPRDIFFFAKKDNVEWIPHNDVHHFIDWYKRLTDKFSIAEKDSYYSVRFEDLVLSYDNTVKGIEDYLGIHSNTHHNIYSCFDPKQSARNIGLWEEDIDKEAYEQIAEELEPLCYHKITRWRN